MNALIVTAYRLAMLFEHCELALQRDWIAVNVTGIAILRHQLERDLLTIASNQQGNMGLLDPFGLVYCARTAYDFPSNVASSCVHIARRIWTASRN